MKKKEITIHKKNEIVRGGDKLSLMGKRALNSVYYLIQKNNLYSAYKFKVRFSILRELMGLNENNDYVDRMKEGLRELMETIELNNWTNPLDGVTYNWYATRFINEVNFKKENDEWFAIIEPNRTITGLMKLKENFTELQLIPAMNKLRTKYAMKLYEFFKSFEKFRYIDLPQDYLLRMLGLQDKKDYQYYSHLARLLKNQIKELNKKTEFEHLKLLEPTKEMKKEKIYRFIINPKSKRTLRDIKKIEEITQSLFKKF